MKRIVTFKTLLTLLFTIAVFTQSAYAQFTTTWSLANADHPGLNSTANVYRGLAYGMVGGNARLYFVSRNTGNHVYILNANTGTAVSELSLTGVAGGALVLNDVGVSDDGVIFACNVSANSDSASPFRCHRWDTEAQAEATHYTYLTPTATRLGDRITVTGSVSGGTLAIWAAGTNNKVYKLTLPSSGTVLDGTEYSTDATLGNQPSVYPYLDGFIVNGNSTYPKYYTTSSSTVQATIPSASVGGSLNNNALRFFTSPLGSKKFLATFSYSGTISGAGAQYSIRIADISSGFASGTSYGDFDIAFAGSNANINASGDVDVRINGDGTATIFAMATNNGIKAVTTSSPLPIELADFTAQTNNGEVTLNWQTISEINSDVFEVQHLAGGEWVTVATVQAAGSSTDVRSYTQAVKGLQVGTHYFRLKSVDKDGGVKYSKQISVSVEVPGTFVMNPAYPNPFNPQTTLTFAVAKKQAVTMTLFNALGQQVSVLYQGAPEANTLQTVQLDGSSLQSGAYFVRLTGENFSGMQKVMLVK